MCWRVDVWEGACVGEYVGGRVGARINRWVGGRMGGIVVVVVGCVYPGVVGGKWVDKKNCRACA
jgi:outer membrane lipoprotein SlyB